jgi:transposase
VGQRATSFGRVFALAAVLTLVGATGHAAADTLTAQLECPAQGPHRACLLVSLVPGASEARCSYNASPYNKTFAISGRLNGAERRQHRLKIERRTSSSNPPSLAYLGQSPSGRTVILTDRGPLEIFNKAFNGSVGGQMYLVDKRRWKIKNRMLAASEAGPFVTTADDIGFWDDGRELCISAPIEPRRRLRPIEGGCKARPREPTVEDRAREIQTRIQSDIRETARAFAGWYASKSTGDITPPPAESGDWVDTPTPNEFAWLGNVEREFVTLKQVSRLLPREVNDDMGSDTGVASHFGGSGTGIRVLKIKGSQTLIISVSYDGGGCD